MIKSPASTWSGGTTLSILNQDLRIPMLRHFPFFEKFDLRMGTSPLPETEPLIECDEHYTHEISLKRKLLEGDHHYYFRQSENSEQAQWEAVAIVLNNLSRFYPDNFVLQKDGNHWKWENRLLNEAQDFILGETKTLPLAPLDWVGRQVQEDLIVLDPDLIVRAGQLCFPSGWDLDGKFEKQFLAVHDPLPTLTNSMIEKANKFVTRIPPNKTFQRNNWGFRVSDQLDLSNRHTAAYAKLLASVVSELTKKTTGDKVFIRMEHQTLSRLPLSSCVLFTIHTYSSLLREEAKDLNRAKIILSFLETVPKELQDYKLITSYTPVMIDYLKSVVNGTEV